MIFDPTTRCGIRRNRVLFASVVGLASVGSVWLSIYQSNPWFLVPAVCFFIACVTATLLVVHGDRYS